MLGRWFVAGRVLAGSVVAGDTGELREHSYRNQQRHDNDAHHNPARHSRRLAQRGCARVVGVGLSHHDPDVAAILLARHERHVADHLEQLAEVRDRHCDPDERLTAVLHAYARIAQQRGHGSSEVVALLHRDEHMGRAQRHLQNLIRDLLADAAASEDVRNDVTPDELASYCLGALGVASSLRTESAVQRLVEVTLDGLRPRG